jgi:hypothetical protein
MKKDKIIILKSFDWSYIWGYPIGVIMYFIIFIISLIPILGIAIIEYFEVNINSKIPDTSKYKRFSEVFFIDKKYKVVEEIKYNKLIRVEEK